MENEQLFVFAFLTLALGLVAEVLLYCVGFTASSPLGLAMGAVLSFAVMNHYGTQIRM